MKSNVRREAQEIIEKLKSRHVHLPGDEETKLLILRRVLRKKKEIIAFAEESGRLDYQVNGYLMELCTLASDAIPRNTPRAERIVSGLLASLQRARQSNPDYLWVRINGNRLIIRGIGEIKTTFAALMRKPRQTYWQEKNILDILGREVNTLTAGGGKKRVFALAEDFFRYLILPRNTSGFPYYHPPYLPSGWEIREIEFTLPEIFEIKRHILSSDDPEPLVPVQESQEKTLAPDVIQSPSPLQAAFADFVRLLMERVEQVVARVFAQHPLGKNASAVRVLTCWTALAGSVPTSIPAIQMAAEWARRGTTAADDPYQPFSMTPRTRIAIQDLTEKEDKEYKGIMTACRQFPQQTSSLVPFTMLFLARLRELRSGLVIPPLQNNSADAVQTIFSLI